MNTYPTGAIGTQTNSIDGNRVLRNTYALLALTLLFSAATAGISMSLNLPHPGLLLTLIGCLVLGLAAWAWESGQSRGVLVRGAAVALAGAGIVTRPAGDDDHR